MGKDKKFEKDSSEVKGDHKNSLVDLLKPVAILLNHPLLYTGLSICGLVVTCNASYFCGKYEENKTGQTYDCPGGDKICSGTSCTAYKLTDNTPFIPQGIRGTKLRICNDGFVRVDRSEYDVLGILQSQTTYLAIKTEMYKLCFSDESKDIGWHCVDRRQAETEGLTPRFEQAQKDYREQLRRFKPYITANKHGKK